MNNCDAFSHMNKSDLKGKYKLFAGIKIKKIPQYLWWTRRIFDGFNRGKNENYYRKLFRKDFCGKKKIEWICYVWNIEWKSEFEH